MEASPKGRCSARWRAGSISSTARWEISSAAGSADGARGEALTGSLARSHRAAHALALFDGELHHALAAFGGFDEGPDVVLALAADGGEEDVGGALGGDEAVVAAGE